MKKLLYTALLFTAFLTLTACDDSEIDDSIIDNCENNEQLVAGKCVVPETVVLPEADTDNLFKLNVGNTDGWELFVNNKTEPSMDIKDGKFTFTQAEKDEDNTWARKLTYSTLDIDSTKDYTVEFNAMGPVYREITIYIGTGNTDSYYEETFTLNGMKQSFSFDIVDLEETVGSGIFVIGLGTFENGDSVTISDIEIKEKVFVEEVNILFIGNSFTYYNNMPNMVEQMGLTNGYNVNVESITNGGYQLIQYMTAGTTATQEVLDKLDERDWDYVVLQEHSNKPDTNKTEFLYSVQELNQLITSKGAQTILYSTWSYRDGSAKLASTGYTYTEFYNSLTNAYKEAAETYGTLRAPVGTAFYNLTMEQSSINLIKSDDFHPNTAGSYVAAFTFYSMIFGEESNNEYLPSGLASDTAAILRTYVFGAIEVE